MPQSKLHSIYEVISSSMVATPTALILHKVMLMMGGENVSNEYQDLFILIVWFVFLLHSMAWKYIVRRVYNRYDVQLDPLHLIKAIRNKIHDRKK